MQNIFGVSQDETAEFIVSFFRRFHCIYNNITLISQAEVMIPNFITLTVIQGIVSSFLAKLDPSAPLKLLTKSFTLHYAE